MNPKLTTGGIIAAILLSIASLLMNAQTSRKIDTVSATASSTEVVVNNQGQALTQVADFLQKEFPAQINNYVSGQMASTTK